MRIEAFLEQSPIFTISRAARRMEQRVAAALEAEELSVLEAWVLAAVFFEAEPVRPSRLAETFSTTRGNISHAVSSLEGRGLIQRIIDPADARSYLLSLRPQGRRVAQKVIRVFDRHQKAAEEELGPTALRETLQQVRRLEKLAEAE